jgi:hypothetical protein
VPTPTHNRDFHPRCVTCRSSSHGPHYQTPFISTQHTTVGRLLNSADSLRYCGIQLLEYNELAACDAPQSHLVFHTIGVPGNKSLLQCHWLAALSVYPDHFDNTDNPPSGTRKRSPKLFSHLLM